MCYFIFKCKTELYIFKVYCAHIWLFVRVLLRLVFYIYCHLFWSFCCRDHTHLYYTYYSNNEETTPWAWLLFYCILNVWQLLSYFYTKCDNSKPKVPEPKNIFFKKFNLKLIHKYIHQPFSHCLLKDSN